MRDLRLIGVHDDGEHLVVVDDAGEQYRLRIDEPLRAAARRDRPRLGQLQIEIDNDVRPREVQAMIRAGATADEVSARTGWSLERIARFEGPVLAEREHIATRAQTVRLRGANAAGATETLGQRAATRLAGRGVEPGEVQWDAARDGEGQWTVSARFPAGGRPREATWWFDVAGMSVVAKNDEAKWLSEADAPAGPVPAQVHRPTSVFDVEAAEPTPARRAPRADADELIASMREHSGARSRRRGRRRAAPTPPVTEDALPLEDGEPTAEKPAVPEEPEKRPATASEMPPAARGPHPQDAVEERPVEGPQRPGTGATDAPEEPETPEPATEEATSPAAEPSEEPEQPTTEEAAAEAATEPEDADEKADEKASPEPEQSSPAPAKKKGRARVPSWDDVMFGAKRD